VDVCVAPPMLLVGGSDPRGDVDALRQHGANLLVGTPGRLHDVMERTEGFLHFKSLELLILDEADRLLGMGFQKYVERHLGFTRPAGSILLICSWLALAEECGHAYQQHVYARCRYSDCVPTKHRELG
jgi:superfamily II DNA/RNA helicase